MADEHLNINSISEPDHLFLASANSSYTYRNLFQFSEYFRSIIDEYNINLHKPLGLHSSSCDELIFVIAACWIHQIPFIPFNPEAKQRKINGVQLSAVITDRPDLDIHSNSLSIDVFDLSNILNKKKFDSSLSKPVSLNSNSDKIFGYFSTSGTSGSPKMVPLKRRQMLAAARSSAQNLQLATNECWLLCMPLHHIGGISVILRSLLYNSAIYRMTKFDTKDTSHLLSSNEQVVAASLVPTMLERLTGDPGFTTHKSFKAILLGGGPIYSSLIEQCIERKIPLITSYGMTETCAQIAANPIHSTISNQKFKSAGKIFEPNKIEIRDTSGSILDDDKSGIIWLKGPQIFDGYLNNKSTNFDDNGWFNTGDFGRLDNDNYLYVESRRTDLIITGGENVSPFEVETVLQEIDPIKEVAVFGVKDKRWGQRVVAAVVTSNKQISKAAIVEYLNDQIEAYKIPKEVIFTNTIPKTATGKIKRTRLSDLLN